MLAAGYPVCKKLLNRQVSPVSQYMRCHVLETFTDEDSSEYFMDVATQAYTETGRKRNTEKVRTNPF